MHTALVSRILKNPSLCEEVTLEGSPRAPEILTDNAIAAASDYSV
jgi:hypothetical protein